MDEMDWDLWNGIILLSTKLSWRWKKEKITAFSHSTGTEDGMDCRLGFHNLGRWSCDLALIWDQWDRGQQVCLDHTENGITSGRCCHLEGLPLRCPSENHLGSEDHKSSSMLGPAGSPTLLQCELGSS
ncbi:uncharacterized protein LJ206_014903 isoform 2-T6 [Theristicus caerulescens]